MELLERIVILKIKLATEEDYVSLLDMIVEMDRQFGGYVIDGLVSLTANTISEIDRLPHILNLFLDRRGRELNDDTQKSAKELITIIKNSHVVDTLKRILQLKEKLQLTSDTLHRKKREQKQKFKKTI